MAKKPTPAQPEKQPTYPVTNPDGTVIDYSATVRMERDSMPQIDGTFKWTVYELKPVNDATHPVIGGDTIETQVWMPEGRGNESDAHALAQQCMQE